MCVPYVCGYDDKHAMNGYSCITTATECLDQHPMEKFGSLTMQFVTYNPNMNYVAISSVVFW